MLPHYLGKLNIKVGRFFETQCRTSACLSLWAPALLQQQYETTEGLSYAGFFVFIFY